MKYAVIDTWDNFKIVHKGTRDDCEKYVKGNNVYQMNYSKLRIKLCQQLQKL